MDRVPRFMIAAPASGTGKTTVTLALLSALSGRGSKPVAFKCGPDYIDPMFHRAVLGIPSYNLDLFFTGGETVCGLLGEHGRGHDIAVIEGVMGYYDGIGADTRASSYELARVTQTPVILTVSAQGASMSVAALINGFKDFRTPGMIAAVILNDCSEPLYKMLKEAVEEETGLKVLGYFPRMPECSIGSRHLGLITAAEIKDIKRKLELLGSQAKKSIDIGALLEIAKSSPALFERMPEPEPVVKDKPRIALAKDEAFCFYYEDNLELLERLGARLVAFSPLHDKKLPEGVGGLYLGGGYPELYASALSENASMRESIRMEVGSGLPTLAECGGYLYLHETLEGDDGKAYPMAGVLKGHGFKTSRLQRFGYISVTANRDNVLCSAGESIPAHEFHYWDTARDDGDCTARRPGGGQWQCIRAGKTLFAGFPHLYFYGNMAFAKGFVSSASAFRKKAGAP